MSRNDIKKHRAKLKINQEAAAHELVIKELRNIKRLAKAREELAPEKEKYHFTHFEDEAGATVVCCSNGHYITHEEPGRPGSGFGVRLSEINFTCGWCEEKNLHREKKWS